MPFVLSTEGYGQREAALRYKCRTEDRTAEGGEDYRERTGMVIVVASSSMRGIPVVIFEDDIEEGKERFVLVLYDREVRNEFPGDNRWRSSSSPIRGRPSASTWGSLSISEPVVCWCVDVWTRRRVDPSTRGPVDVWTCRRVDLPTCGPVTCGPVDPADLSPGGLVDVRTCRRADLPTCGLVAVRTCRRADLSTCGLVDARTCRRADLSACGPADMRTCRHGGPADMWARRHVDPPTCGPADSWARRPADSSTRGPVDSWTGRPVHHSSPLRARGPICELRRVSAGESSSGGCAW